MQVGSAANSAASVAAAAAKEPHLHYLVHLRLGGRAENEFKCLAFDVPMCLRKRRISRLFRYSLSFFQKVPGILVPRVQLLSTLFDGRGTTYNLPKHCF